MGAGARVAPDGSGLPPGPRGGAATNVPMWLLEPLRTLRWCAERYGDCFTLELGAFGRFVFVADPHVIGSLFTTDPAVVRAGEPNAVLAPIVGRRSVLTSDGARHLRQRKLLLPAFHGKVLEAYRSRMREAAEAMVERWPVGRPFPVAPQFARLTLEVIVDLVFGVEDRGRRSRLVDLLPRLSRAATLVMFVPALEADRGPGSPGRRFRRLREEADAVVMAELKERRGPGAGTPRDDVLSLLLAARDEHGQAMTDDELRDELMTLLLAGHETTATALAWALDLVLHDDRVHRRLVASATEGESDYADAVIKEVHRLRPTVPNVVRQLT
ncbi:MAG: cytochrome P450, partial [Actinobacteria bacterium]|nr:cytochrome P450 [Actinomycetota bacterium]